MPVRAAPRNQESSGQRHSEAMFISPDSRQQESGRLATLGDAGQLSPGVSSLSSRTWFWGSPHWVPPTPTSVIAESSCTDTSRSGWIL